MVSIGIYVKLKSSETVWTTTQSYPQSQNNVLQPYTNRTTTDNQTRSLLLNLLCLFN